MCDFGSAKTGYKKAKRLGMREDIDTSAKVMMVFLTLMGPRHVSLMQPNLFGRDWVKQKVCLLGSRKMWFPLLAGLQAALTSWSSSGFEQLLLALIWTSFASYSSGCNIVSGVMAVLSWEALPSANRGWSHASSSRLVHEPRAFGVSQVSCRSKSLGANPWSWVLRGALHHFRRAKRETKKNQMLHEVGEFRNFHLSCSNTWPLSLRLEEGRRGPWGWEDPWSRVIPAASSWLL